jgi:hypothetical protein
MGMRRYHIYLIEEEFASHYFGREAKIFELFWEYENAINEQKVQLRKQIDYVTRPIPTLHIHQYIDSLLRKRSDYQNERNIHCLMINSNRSEARMVVHDRYLLLESSGNYEAETNFFEVLRKYDPCFLAMDFALNRYGWLNPIKERKFV